MGTNYYIRTNVCNHCWKGDTFHAGKRSFDSFVFATHDKENYKVSSYRDLLGYVNHHSSIIVDEYDEFIPKDNFIAIISENQAPEYKTKMIKEYPNYYYLDLDGYLFMNTEFS